MRQETTVRFLFRERIAANPGFGAGSAHFHFLFWYLILAVAVFPKSYDWRSSVISNLLSPRHNPEFHWLASLGLSLTGLLAIPFGGYIGHRLRPVSPLGANIGMASFIGGFIALILAALIVTRRSHPIFGVPGIHEILARTSALGLGIGIICFSRCAHRGSRAALTDRRLYPRSLVVSWTILTFLALVTLTGCVCSVLIPKIGVPGLSPLCHSPFLALGLLGMDRLSRGFPVFGLAPRC